jgi:hypothetical protein
MAMPFLCDSNISRVYKTHTMSQNRLPLQSRGCKVVAAMLCGVESLGS